MRHGLARLLANAGYRVTDTASGADGLRLYREQGADLVLTSRNRCGGMNTPPDIVLTDILMPDMNGIDVIRGLQELAPQLPVIAMSAGERSRDFELLANAKVLGAMSLLRKPFSKNELLTVVEAALGKAPRGDFDRPVPT